MDIYRAFISYSHDDASLAERMAAHLETQGVKPMWDRNFAFGHGFHDQIKIFISHSHFFIPIITEASIRRGWVQQEIGYAMALNVPVLPVAVGIRTGEMLELHHAAFLEDRDSPIEELLQRDVFEQLLEAGDDPTLAHYSCAEQPEDRACMMHDYARDVLRLREAGIVRQSGALSSFHIPRETIDSPVWSDRYGGTTSRGGYHCRVLRNERMALEQHFKRCGCRLIVNPEVDYEQFGTRGRLARLGQLVKFLEADWGDAQIEIARGPEKKFGSNLTIVGDWFVAESVYGTGTTGYLQTMFTRHAPTILARIELFDNEFKEALHSRPWPKAPTSREGAIIYLKDLIASVDAGRPGET